MNIHPLRRVNHDTAGVRVGDRGSVCGSRPANRVKVNRGGEGCAADHTHPRAEVAGDGVGCNRRLLWATADQQARPRIARALEVERVGDETLHQANHIARDCRAERARTQDRDRRTAVARHIIGVGRTAADQCIAGVPHVNARAGVGNRPGATRIEANHVASDRHRFGCIEQDTETAVARDCVAAQGYVLRATIHQNAAASICRRNRPCYCWVGNSADIGVRDLITVCRQSVHRDTRAGIATNQS